MPLSTSPSPFPPEAGPAAHPAPGPVPPLDALERFYRFHSRIYDWTRPFLLFGRGAAVRALETEAGQLVLDVGCGTGWSLPLLAKTGAGVIGIEPSASMRRRSENRLARRGLGGRVPLDPRPYGTHAGYEGQADRILFSYALSMIPQFGKALEAARRDLVRGGRIVVVDFLDAALPVAAALRASHVDLGRARLDALCRLFPSHDVRITSVGLWRFFLFQGSEDGRPPLAVPLHQPLQARIPPPPQTLILVAC